MYRVACFAAVLSFQLAAVAAEPDCSAAIAEIDRRIATGDYPAQNVQIAQQMKQSLSSMCAFVDQGTLDAMMESVEDLLPTKTEEERLAERRARSAELKAERDTRKAAEAQAQAAREARVSPIVRAAPTGRRVAAKLLNRGEVMYHTWTWDRDIHEGNLRVLYSSFPDRTQYGLPDWTLNVYVAEMTPDGAVTHRHVTGRQSSDHTALALRRGHDEVLFERGPQERGGPSYLERWSISEGRLLSSVRKSDISWTIDGEAWQGATYQVATSDGNLLYMALEGGSRADPQVRLGWFKVSPEGRLLGSDTYSIEDSVSPWAWTHTNNGGGGIIVDVMPVDGVQLASGLRLPEARARHGSMLASVSRERRLVIVDGQGGLASPPMVIERDLFETAEPGYAVPQSIDDMNAAVADQFDWIEGLRNDFDANRSTEYMDVGPRRVEMVREIDGGFAALTRVIADTDLEPSIHGAYILEFDRSGGTKPIYLQPLTEDLDVDLKAFVPAPGGGYYLYGFDLRDPATHVLRIGADGALLQRSRLPTEGITIDGIEADRNGVWLYGHAYLGKEPARLYLERVAFD
jgi:hypothetical protein